MTESQQKQEVQEARKRVSKLWNRGLSPDDIAKRLSGEFFISIYPYRGKVYGAYVAADRDMSQVTVRL